MKKPYKTPKLMEYGSVSVLTELRGSSSDVDHLVFCGFSIPISEGSEDVNLTPWWKE